MEERDNRNIMCSVLFLDIVEYSKKTVAGQISLKDRFNSYLSTAIQDIPVDDRIILDTGDGAAINFLGDVEDALKAAISLRESMLNEDPNLDPPLLVRMGINLGPVRLVRDINGQPNIVGDGINVAQRVMAFADASQILVSRSYYDAASRISPNYAGMFHYQGSRTDKHVREHEIYAIGYPGDKTGKLPTRTDVAEQTADVPAGGGWHFPAVNPGLIARGLVSRFSKAPPVQRALLVGALAILMATIVILKLPHAGKMPAVQAQAPKGDQPASAVASGMPLAESKTEGTGHAVKPVTKVKPDKTIASKVDSNTKGKPDKTVESKTASITKDKPDIAKVVENKMAGNAEPAKRTLKVADPVQPGATEEHFTDAYILVICHEGTRVYLDGADIGKLTSTELSVVVSPGKHHVIVNGRKGEIHEQSAELKPGKIFTIKPDFCNP